MKYFAVLGCVTDIGDASPYMCKPATTREQAVENWYLAACENHGIDAGAFPPESAEHESFIDIKMGLREATPVFSDSEAFTLEEFEI